MPGFGPPLSPGVAVCCLRYRPSSRTSAATCSSRSRAEKEDTKRGDRQKATVESHVFLTVNKVEVHEFVFTASRESAHHQTYGKTNPKYFFVPFEDTHKHAHTHKEKGGNAIITQYPRAVARYVDPPFYSGACIAKARRHKN